ncbi:hypothetical protein [Alishewanella longhuensis]
MIAQHKTLLAIALVLAVLQFWLVPTLQQQQSQQQQLQQLSQQLGRAQAVKASEATLNALLDNLPSIKTNLIAHYPLQTANQPAGQLRLDLQQQVQQQLAGHAVTLQVFDWLGQQQHPQLGISELQARVVLVGQPAALLQAYSAAFANKPAIAIMQADWQYFARSQVTEPATLTLLVTITVLDEATLTLFQEPTLQASTLQEQVP